MKICAIEFSGKGAMVQYDFHMCRGLSRAGVDATLLVARNSELRQLDREFRVVELFDLWDIYDNSVKNTFLRKLRRIYRGALFIKAWFHAINFVRREKPDIVVIGIVRFAFEYIFIRILKSLGFPVMAIVHDVHNFDYRPGKPILRQDKTHIQQYSQIYNLCDALFVHDRTNREEFLKLYNVPAEKVHEIPLPAGELVLELTPDRTPEQLRKEFNVKPGQPVVTFFGNINKYKGVEVLVEAFAAIHRATGARLIIAGHAGKDMNITSLKAIAKKGGVLDHVTWFLEYLPNERLMPLMQISNVVVYPYKHVTQSGALKMAYMMGRPVVATRVGGLPDVVENGKNGFLVPPENPDALAEAVIKVVSNPELAEEMGRTAKQIYETRFSWRILCERVLATSENILRQRQHEFEQSQQLEPGTEVSN